MNKSIIAQQKRILQYFLHAGIERDAIGKLHKKVFSFATLLHLFGALWLYFGIFQEMHYTARWLLGFYILYWTLMYAVTVFLSFLVVYGWLDLRIHRRKRMIETVFPEYLHLVAANIRAGMLIDQALWAAIQPKFGVLAKEMETVAKEVASGKDLKKALQNFGQKYDSLLLHQSLAILLEGMESGGKIADILTKIAENLSEMALQKKEMAAAVSSYGLFISFAAIVAAPVLLALAGQLLEVIKRIMVILTQTKMPMQTFFQPTMPTLTASMFTTFSIALLLVTSFFSALILANIQKGTVKDGFKYIPLFLIISLVIFFLSSKLLAVVFGNFVL